MKGILKSLLSVQNAVKDIKYNDMTDVFICMIALLLLMVVGIIITLLLLYLVAHLSNDGATRQPTNLKTKKPK